MDWLDHAMRAWLSPAKCSWLSVAACSWPNTHRPTVGRRQKSLADVDLVDLMASCVASCFVLLKRLSLTEFPGQDSS